MLPYHSTMKSEKITVLIIDEDPLTREILDINLRSVTEFDILGYISSLTEASRLFIESIPDLIMLDAALIDKSGFNRLFDLRRLYISPSVILMATSDKYALPAIKHGVFDYLLKPINKDELFAALQRYKTDIWHLRLREKIDRLFSYLSQHEKIRFNTRHGFIMINPMEVVFCQADWSYTEIYLINGTKAVVSMNIGRVEELLDPSRFFRINRSIIINRSNLLSVDRKAHRCRISHHGTELEFPLTGMHLHRMDSVR